MPLLKNGFLEKIETWHVGLSCQYTHFMSFSSKSEHDTIADQATLRPRAVMALENVDSFQYMMYKIYQKNKSGPEKNQGVALNFLIPGAQMALEIYGIFQPLHFCHFVKYGRIRIVFFN